MAIRSGNLGRSLSNPRRGQPGYEYRRVDESEWATTTAQLLRKRCVTREYTKLISGEATEITSRDGALVFRKREIT